MTVFCCGDPAIDDPECLSDALMMRLVELTDLEKPQIVPEETTEEGLPRIQVRDLGEQSSERYPDFRSGIRRFRCRYYGRSKANSVQALRHMILIEKDDWVVSKEGCACPFRVTRGPHYRRFGVWIAEVEIAMNEFSP